MVTRVRVDPLAVGHGSPAVRPSVAPSVRSPAGVQGGNSTHNGRSWRLSRSPGAAPKQTSPTGLTIGDAAWKAEIQCVKNMGVNIWAAGGAMTANLIGT